MARSSDPIHDVPGVPGLSALRTRRFSVVTPEMMQGLRAIAAAYGRARVSTGPTFDIGVLSGTDTTYQMKEKELQLFGTYFREGDQPRLDYEMNPTDEQQILAAIRDGKAHADFLVATIHAHESPAAFVQKIAREAIDNGADAFVGHGPHRLLGIEIYKGRPIFYGLSNFFNQTALKEPVTLDEYERWGEDPDTVSPAEFSLRWSNRAFNSHEVFQAVIAVSRYAQGRLAEVRLQPVDLDFNARPADRGTPRLAGPAASREILERIQTQSKPYGTALTIQNGVGVIAVDPSAGTLH
jgi:poly-gamma-glutamate synthesis protein (capsule biosynthesis protein)